MAYHPGHRHREDDYHDSSHLTDKERKHNGLLTASISMSMEMPTGTYYDSPAGVTSTSYYSQTQKLGPWSYPPDYTSISRYPPWFPERTPTSLTTKVKQTPYLEGVGQTSLSTSALIAINTLSSYSTASADDGYHGQRPGWGRAREPSNRGMIYAVAAVVPIVVLLTIGCIVFFCLRKRKRQSQEAAATQTKVEEMKLENGHGKEPCIATPCSLPQYSASPIGAPPAMPICPQPIILSGSNGAYLTGMDTSDMVSMTSSSNVRTDPFADNNSLSEAPPPYRPRSVVPSSIAPSSRQNSVRVTSPRPTCSQTYFMERSPFEDPIDDEDDDDDAISELDEPVQRGTMEAMSVVSDVSCQDEPIVRRAHAL